MSPSSSCAQKTQQNSLRQDRWARYHLAPNVFWQFLHDIPWDWFSRVWFRIWFYRKAWPNGFFGVFEGWLDLSSLLGWSSLRLISTRLFRPDNEVLGDKCQWSRGVKERQDDGWRQALTRNNMVMKGSPRKICDRIERLSQSERWFNDQSVKGILLWSFSSKSRCIKRRSLLSFIWTVWCWLCVFLWVGWILWL